MNLRVIASFAVAIFLGLIAVMLVRMSLTGHHGGAGQTAVATTPVVVAAAPIERGATLQPTMFKLVNYPADAVPANSLHSLAPLGGPDAASHVALRAMAANEPILTDKVSGLGAKAGLSGSMTPGMRAVSIKSSDVAGVSGFALPGDRVDILVTRTIGSGDAATTVTQVLAENVRVLGVDQSDDEQADKPVASKTLTVEVSPDEAQSISLAQSVGTVTLALRQMADSASLTRHATTTADLGTFGVRAHPAASAPAAKVKRALGPGMTEVKVARGVEISSFQVSAF